MVFELHVDMEDGGSWDVVADQRDIAKWEVQPFGWPIGRLIGPDGEGDPSAVSLTFLRWLAWSASSRQQYTKLGWPEFNDVCVDVAELEDQAPDAVDALDPGQPAPSVTASSRSRKRRVNL